MRPPDAFRGLAAAIPVAVLFTVLAIPAGLAGAAEKNKSALDTRLKEAERALEKGKDKSRRLERRAGDLAAKLARMRRDRIKTAGGIQALEAKITAIEEAISHLDRDAAEMTRRLVERRRLLAGVLATLQRLTRHPPEALIIHPGTPSRLVRAAILLRSTVPRFEAVAAELKIDLESVDGTRRQIRSQRVAMLAASTQLLNAQRRLDGLIVLKSAETRRAATARDRAARQAARLAGEARTLRQLFARLRRQKTARKKAGRQAHTRATALARPRNLVPGPRPQPFADLPPPKPGLPFTKARGKLPFPAMGRITGRFGDRLSRGLNRKGIRLATRNHARVIAPHDGKVVFSGPFRGYGLLLIIDHGEGYHTLLAGMERIDVMFGQSLLAGEPVGVMGAVDGGKTSLYVELRRQGKPINPAPWLVAQKDKASG